MAGQRQHLAARRQQFAHQAGGSLSGAIAVLPDKAQPAAAWNIRVERDDRDVLPVQLVDALAQFGGVIGGKRKALNALRDQFFDALEQLLVIQPLEFAHQHFAARVAQFVRCAAHALAHDLHGRRFGGLQDHAEFGALLGAHKRLPDQIGLVAQLGGDLPDAGRDLRVDAAAVVQRAVHRSAGYAGYFCNFLSGDSHGSSLLPRRPLWQRRAIMLSSISHCTRFSSEKPTKQRDFVWIK